jgi:hypothetical protein
MRLLGLVILGAVANLALLTTGHKDISDNTDR